MIFLPNAWRFVVYNKDTGVTLDFAANSANESLDVSFRQANGDGSGGATWDGSRTVHSASTDLASGSYEALTSITGETHVDMFGQIAFETDNTSADGDLIIGIELSDDGGTTWPSDSTDWDPDVDLTIIGQMNISGATTRTIDWVY